MIFFLSVRVSIKTLHFESVRACVRFVSPPHAVRNGCVSETWAAAAKDPRKNRSGLAWSSLAALAKRGATSAEEQWQC